MKIIPIPTIKDFIKIQSKIRFVQRCENLSMCWEWQGPKDRDGYGQFNVHSWSYKVHRLAYEWFSGNTISDSAPMICHHCDNPSCCNPDHLYAGTNKSNTADRVLRQRNHDQWGENNGSSKLRESLVLLIREIYKTWHKEYRPPQYQIAEILGISNTHISRIIRNLRWNKIE